MAAQREPRGHVAQLKFVVPSSGTYAFSVMVLSDYWIGVDAKYPVKIKVGRKTQEVIDARAAAAAGKNLSSKKKKAISDKKKPEGGAADTTEGADLKSGEKVGEIVEEITTAMTAMTATTATTKDATATIRVAIAITRRTKPAPRNPATRKRMRRFCNAGGSAGRNRPRRSRRTRRSC